MTYFGHCAPPCDVLCIYVQEWCIGKCPCLHRREYILVPFLRDFLVVQTDPFLRGVWKNI